jgi:hypothetical protein
MLWKTLIKQYFVSGKSDCINMRSIVGARLSRKYFYFLNLLCAKIQDSGLYVIS